MSLRFLTAGESHGKALVGILEGMPSGLPLSVRDIREQLVRRKKGYGRGNRQKIENEGVEFLAGVRHGKTLGSPIALLVPNVDFKNWDRIMSSELVRKGPQRRVDIPRPGHADFVGALKYGFSDMRNVLERASARETAMRVSLASVARVFLKACGVSVASRVIGIGEAYSDGPPLCNVSELNALADKSPVRCTDRSAEKSMMVMIDRAKAQGDTVGGVFEVYADGLAVGLGSYAHWDRRLEGSLSAAVMSLNAIKGVEFGLGFDAGRVSGSWAHDEFILKNRKIAYKSNRSGGLDGGMTTGQPLVIRAAMKPLATLLKPLQSVNLKTKKPAKAHIERSDICAVPSAAVIAESLVCLVLANAFLEKFGGDSMGEFLPRLKAWRP